MRHATYFERLNFESHITLAEWQFALRSVSNVRIATTASLNSPNSWVGYFVNASAVGRQFHELPDRQHDAEVFFPATGEWRRAIYWHDASDRYGAGVGVVNFETRDVDPDDPIWVAVRALAHELDAELRGEDDTKYEA